MKTKISAVALLGLAFLGFAVSNIQAKEESMQNERYAKGFAAISKLNPQGAQRSKDFIMGIAPDMWNYVVEFGYGDIFSRPGLEPKARQCATIAALSALGYAAPQLKFHVAGGLNSGLTPDEIVEIVYLTTVFAGFPAGINALGVCREVFSEEKVEPKHPQAHQGQPENRRERGLKALEATSQGAGAKVLASLEAVAPDMAGFILDFSYGDVISRSVLDPKLKELAMIASAAARGSMLPQLKVHVKAGLAVGLGKQEIIEALIQMAAYAGFPASLNALGAASEAFKESGV